MNRESPVILLHADDNVLVCRAPVQAGQILQIDAVDVVAIEEVIMGHKIARRALSRGEQVIKYGVPIGVTTAAVPRGAHVHLHNMISSYIPSHTRQTVDRNRN